MVSIIVPVYNASKTLERCIDSILSQTIPEKEIILVNDGSSDNSPDVMLRYAELHSEIVAINKPNGGVSSARNAGLAVARGEYVTFIDSDDFYTEDNYISNMLLKIEADEKCDLVVSGFTILTNNSKKPFSAPQKTVSACELARDFYSEYKSGDLMNSACNKLFRREKIKVQFGEKLTMGEDAVFVLEYLRGCRNIAFCSGCGYGYIFMNTSSTADFRKNTAYDISQTNVYHSAILKFWLSFLPEDEAAINYIKMRVDAVYKMVSAIILKKGYLHFLRHNISDMLCDNNLKAFEQYAISLPESYKNIGLVNYVIAEKSFAVKCYVASDLLKKKLFRRNRKS